MPGSLRQRQPNVWELRASSVSSSAGGAGSPGESTVANRRLAVVGHDLDLGPVEVLVAFPAAFVQTAGDDHPGPSVRLSATLSARPRQHTTSK